MPHSPIQLATTILFANSTHHADSPSSLSDPNILFITYLLVVSNLLHTHIEQHTSVCRYKTTNRSVEVAVGFVDALQIHPNMFQQVIAFIRGP
jgi:hypothetical protein